jgi:hypothetical protein
MAKSIEIGFPHQISEDDNDIEYIDLYVVVTGYYDTPTEELDYDFEICKTIGSEDISRIIQFLHSDYYEEIALTVKEKIDAFIIDGIDEAPDADMYN